MGPGFLPGKLQLKCYLINAGTDLYPSKSNWTPRPSVKYVDDPPPHTHIHTYPTDGISTRACLAYIKKERNIFRYYMYVMHVLKDQYNI